MLVRHAPMFRDSDTTPELVYVNRRAFIIGLGAVALVGAFGARRGCCPDTGPPVVRSQPRLSAVR